MPKPGPAQLQLHKLAGNWIGEEKLSPSPWDAKGGTAAGKIDNRLALDGWAVVQEYEQTRNGKVSFKGHGVFSIDAAKQCPMMTWYDSVSGGPQIFTGAWKGDVLTLSSEGPQGLARCTFDMSAGGYRFTMEVSPDAKEWFTFMTGLYRRGAEKTS